MSTFDLENPDPQPGDSLRDEAANLLSARYGRPVREMRAKGKKTDLYFVRRDFGKAERFYVEAKDYDRNLSRTEVVHIWADYSGIVEMNRPATLLIVTRGGLSADAQSYVLDERPELRHQTIWELENEALGLTDFIRHLRGVFDEDGLSSYYVEGMARRASYVDDERAISDASYPVFGEVQDWLTSDERRPVAILGGYGAGKSSLARRIVAAQATLALKDPTVRRPVLIPLGNLARYSNLEGLLGGMFSHDFPSPQGFHGRNFLDLNRKGRLLIVLDGFDEMKHAMSWSDFRAQIQDLNRLTQGESKVLLLGRPSAFTSTDEHFHVLRGVKRFGEGWRRLPDWPEFMEYDLEEFTAAERSTFFRGYLRHLVSGLGDSSLNDAWIEHRVAEVERIAAIEPELFGKPVHAKILIDLASDPKVDLSRFAAGITRWGLYEIFFTSLAEREMEKEVRRPIGEGERIAFLREVAFWLWTECGGATSFSAGDIPDRVFDNLAVGESADPESLKREYLTGSFLEKKSGDIFYFGHRSFAEYLVADRMVKNPPSPRDHSAYSSLVRGGVLDFLRDAPDRSQFGYWIDSLSTPIGTIHLEYLAFLAEMMGGVDKLRQELPAPSIWLPILDLFETSIEFDASLTLKLVDAMRTEHNVLFFLLMSLLQLQLAARNVPKQDAAVLIAGILLERLLMRATYDDTSRKASVEPDADEAKTLAQAVIAEVSTVHFDRRFRFRGRRLLEEKEQRLRVANTDIGTHEPVKLIDLAEEFSLPFDDVLQRLSPKSRALARAYFARASSLRDIFTRQVSPNRRVKAKPAVEEQDGRSGSQ